MIHQVEAVIGGRRLVFESGKMAKQATGAVMAQYGDTTVLSAVVQADPRSGGQDFFPLTVDYREKTSAAGRFPGGFFKREGRPTEKEILTMRCIDRPVRPLFPDGFNDEIQIMASVHSADPDNDPDVVAMNASFAALEISPIPFLGPVAAVRIGKVEGKLVVNPTYEQMETSTLDLLVAGRIDAILMVEGGAHEESEESIIEALEFAREEIGKVIKMMVELREKCGEPKQEFVPHQVDPKLAAQVDKFAKRRMREAIVTVEKKEREKAIKALTEETLDKFTPPEDSEAEPEEVEKDIKTLLESIEKEVVRELIMKENKRADGRGTTEIRPIECEVGLLPRTHGSALFTRGQTQSLASCTLGTTSDEQIVDSLIGEESKRFMLHYNFPPFCVGEARMIRGPGRREIGHGALAERAITPVLPDPDDFPYTMRITSDILESNGSSSMASVCAGTLSLMDAGVPIRKPVAGIAMGLVWEDGKYKILSDILGLEDHTGDMDFKITGTRQGITAFQMDTKIEGISRKVMAEALEQARQGRLHILDKMEAALAEPRPDLKPFAPRITIIHVPVASIGDVIGPGGKIIRGIIAETGAKIDIDDDGRVLISSSDAVASNRARSMIEALTAEVEVGKIYDGKVVRLMDFGAFVEILPGKEGLVHISQLASYRVNKVEDIVKEGDAIRVKCHEIDDRGRINLSRKMAMDEEGIVEDAPEGYQSRPPRDDGPRRDRSSRDGGRDRGGRGGRSGGGGGGRDRGPRR